MDRVDVIRAEVVGVIRAEVEGRIKSLNKDLERNIADVKRQSISSTIYECKGILDFIDNTMNNFPIEDTEEDEDKAAEAYALIDEGRDCFGRPYKEYREGGIDGFKAGVQWHKKQIVSVWHDKEEKPNIGKRILAICVLDKPFAGYYYEINPRYIRRWAYVEDLIKL